MKISGHPEHNNNIREFPFRIHRSISALLVMMSDPPEVGKVST
jgi:hypothetical protein